VGLVGFKSRFFCGARIHTAVVAISKNERPLCGYAGVETNEEEMKGRIQLLVAIINDEEKYCRRRAEVALRYIALLV
jgi:hypothetical protein